MERPGLDILVVGGGVFGTSAALELARRGHRVKLLEAGTLPHPRASSTDISKLVRMDYGSDGFYAELAERALAGWRRWNGEGAGSSPLFHETGLLVLAGEPMRPGGFEHESWALLTARGHPLERLRGDALHTRFPAWAPGRYPDGYLNPRAGWVESGRAVARFAALAAAAGVELLEGIAFGSLLERGSRVAGVRTVAGEDLPADRVLVSAGAWTPLLLPWLERAMRPIAQPVLLFRPERAEQWRADRFPPWCADIARTGWYGFPLHASGVVKVGHHGAGWAVDPDRFTSSAPDAHALPAETEPRFRDFLAQALPDLAGAHLAEARVCLYCDTVDGDLWIGPDPERDGLVVAAGGSGHGFKFAPVLGPIIADAVEGRVRPELARLGWRSGGGSGSEQARAR